jgi:hypothetical protein
MAGSPCALAPLRPILVLNRLHVRAEASAYGPPIWGAFAPPEGRPLLPTVGLASMVVVSGKEMNRHASC